MLRKFDLTEFHSKRIVCKKVSCKKISNSKNILNGFHCLKASDHTSHCSDDTSLFTGRYGILWRRIFEYTSVTWSFSRNIGHKLSLETKDSCVREWFLCHNAGIIDQEFRRKIIGSVNNEIIILDQIHDCFRIYESLISLYCYIRVDGFHGFFRRKYFSFTDIFRCMNDLTLKIGKVYLICICNSDSSHTCCCEVKGCRCSQSPCSDDQDAGIEQFFLSFCSNLFQNDMSGITFELIICECHYLPPPMKYRNSTLSPSFNA